jgi:hypothetical protein
MAVLVRLLNCTIQLLTLVNNSFTMMNVPGVRTSPGEITGTHRVSLLFKIQYFISGYNFSHLFFAIHLLRDT